MGGKLALESTPGIGSAFTLHVSLPAAEAAQTGYHVPRHDHARALIVAAGDIEAPLIARRLNNWGMETQIRSDAAEAAADIGKECWDTVMVDLNVGIKNAIAIARQSQPAIARRIVLLTPQERRDLPALTAEGFSDYLIKPVRAESLAARFGAPSADVGEAEPPRNKTISRAVKPLTILVAEDNEINALLARALLARLGHVPIVVGGGEEAVETFRAAVARQHPFDLVLMDVQMPGVDGLAATRRIRAFEAELGRAETPIVALTANVSAEDRDTCLKAGMSSFLTKPLDRERLAEALEVAPKRGLAA
jgi:CheY-like chemotaxis protein